MSISYLNVTAGGTSGGTLIGIYGAGFPLSDVSLVSVVVGTSPCFVQFVSN